MMFKALLLLLIGAVSFAASGPHPDWPQITGVDIDEFSLDAHHTHHYRLEYGFVVRRGFHFDVVVTTDKPLRLRDSIHMSDEDGLCHFSTKLMGRHQPEFDGEENDENRRFRYRLRVKTSHEAPINKYENIVFHVTSEDRGHPDKKTESFQFEYPFPIYLIFNPFNPEDEVNFPDREGRAPYDPELLQEYIMNERGLIWSGSENDHEEQKWYYGQFDQIVLDSFFELIKDIDPSHRSSALKVGYHLSRNQGYVTTMGPPFGNPKGVLEGRWTSEFPDAYKMPGDWESTVDILDAWNNKFDHNPVKYGQCWVFAAVQTSFLRAIGIATRQIECFDGRIDKSATFYPDKKMRHVVNFYYDSNGTEVKREGHVWNFHSWNDVYIRRDRHDYSGWQALDGTPKGLGAASVWAVHELDEKYPNDTATLVSSVHATVQRWLVNCTDASHTHCDLKKRLKYEADGVNLIVTKPPLMEGKQKITDNYVKRGVDVFDGTPHNPWAKNSNDLMISNLDDSADNLEILLDTKSTRVVVGDPVIFTVQLAGYENPDSPIKVGLTADIQTYMGETVKTIATRELLVTPSVDNKGIVEVDVKEYLLPHMNDLFVDVRVIAVEPTSGHTAFAHARLPIRSPRAVVYSPPAVATNSLDTDLDDTFNVIVQFTNPYDFDLAEVCLRTISHDLVLAANEDKIKCFKALAGQDISTNVEFITPDSEGRFSVSFTIGGKYLPSRREYVDVNVVNAHTGLQYFRGH